MACGDFKDLLRRTASDKVLCDKAFIIAKIPRCDWYHCGPAWWFINLFIEKSTHSETEINFENQQRIAQANY